MSSQTSAPQPSGTFFKKLIDLLSPKIIIVPASGPHVVNTGSWFTTFGGTYGDVMGIYKGSIGEQTWKFSLPEPSRVVEIDILYVGNESTGGKINFTVNGKAATPLDNTLPPGGIQTHSIFLQYFGQALKDITVTLTTNGGYFEFTNWVIKYWTRAAPTNG